MSFAKSQSASHIPISKELNWNEMGKSADA